MRAALAAVLAATLAAAGCSAESDETAPAAGPKTVTLEVSYDDLLAQKTVTREATLAVGDTLQVSLGTNPSTGYQWASDMTISDPDVLTQTGHEVLAAAQDRPGAAGRAVWALQATGRGTTTVSTRYGQPWEGGEKGSWTFTATVTVN